MDEVAVHMEKRNLLRKQWLKKSEAVPLQTKETEKRETVAVVAPGVDAGVSSGDKTSTQDATATTQVTAASQDQAPAPPPVVSEEKEVEAPEPKSIPPAVEATA